MQRGPLYIMRGVAVFFALLLGTLGGVHLYQWIGEARMMDVERIEQEIDDAQSAHPIVTDQMISGDHFLEERGAVIEEAPVVKQEASSSSTPLSSRPPQFVLLAYDGSRSLDMWKKTRDFAREMKQKDAPVRFTYFVSGVYFLGYNKLSLYTPPGHATGTSLIGFGLNAHEVGDRIEQINGAIDEGHEMGSHVNGHYNGSTWSEADWQSEFSQFHSFLEQTSAINGLAKETDERREVHLPAKGIEGFRAPELGVSPGLWPVLVREGYRYDTSLTAKWDVWPTKDAHGLWEFPLAQIHYNTSSRSILSMDYNFYFKQSKAVDVAKKGSPEWQRFHDEMLTSYRNYFLHNYQGNRAPVYIGHHFSEWNDGAYWEAMKDFAGEVCGQPEVRCVTFSELADYLDAQVVK